ncbi:D-glycero-beta-D-manno-heptose 1-phosphate adenylyltransferase [Burkholderiaceae bacterium DAT-1]|nr:D-glycero-beta-D-manno-heptose 1-phosphate adenylyltransferase [Burkholderiaceae bacterium DAT-1]
MTEYDQPAFIDKVCTHEALVQRLQSLPRPLVFTNGCFDILHRGHVTYLAQARALGASMIVAVNTDDSVKRQGKGDDRPINPEANRMAVLAALEAVDLVTCFDTDTPYDLIQLVQPDILVKGGDWTPDRIVGATEVLARGGQVHSIPFLFDTSTTATLKKIRGA